jgi:phosphotransferase system enzyme I (PtsI)
VLLLANVSDPRAAAEAAAAGAQGIGLLRTEFLFLDQARPPGIGEQSRQYAAVFAAFPGRKVVVRTLDAGADKPLAFLENPVEPNPALGVRGIRVGDGHSDVLTAQLEAIARAAAQSDAEVSVMAPMIATPQESAGFVAMAREAGLERAGVMVEVPAAVLLANEIFPGVDFVSIGTNDLSQYTFAADRQHGELADLLDPWQPALLRMVALCAEAGRAAGKPVGVCGEAAADPLLATVLVGLGVTSLSMSARSVPAVRDALARHTLAECRRNAELALAAPDPEAARRAVRAAG